MRSRDIIIFFTIVFIIYSGVNAYLYFKGAHAFTGILSIRLYNILFILISFSFIAGKILERRYSSVLSDSLNVIGGFWLSFMLYSVIIILPVDLTALVLRLAGVLSPDATEYFRKVSYLAAFGAALLVIIAGFTNTVFPVVRKYRLSINKPAATRSIRIAAISDIHLGSIIRRRSMRLLSSRLNAIGPDMVLFLGDIVDGEINPVLRSDLLESLSLPSSARHVFAITGNHEFIGNHDKTIPYIEGKGIKILFDEVVALGEGIQLAGRIDRDARRYTGQGRKDLDDLLAGVDKGKPVIVLDHQPPLKNENGLSGFDLMLSGHTHNGQMWPLNYLTSKVYKIKYGHRIIDGCHYIVSSGFGSWGPRVRLGSRSEILEIDLEFNNQTDDTASLSGSNFLR